MAFRIHRGIWQFQKPDGAYESKYKLNESGQLVETDTEGNEIGGMTASVSWTSVSGRPTALSSFTNDLGNYGGWITTSGSISGNAATATLASTVTINYSNNSYNLIVISIVLFIRENPSNPCSILIFE